MRKHKRILNILAKVAESNERVANASIAAAVVCKNEIIGIGYNQKRTDPFQAKYGTTKHHIYLHAEIHAIKNALNHLRVDSFSRCDLYVCRIRKDGVWALSKPCEGCERAILQFGIKQVIYTVDDNKYIAMRNYNA